MRRRNAIMAALSIIFIVLLLIVMVLAVSTGLGALGLGAFSFAVLLGVVILAFPLLIFVLITVILLTIEASRATRVGRKHWWHPPPTQYPEPHSTIHVETHTEEHDR
jgi:hypothetical protein